MKWPFTKTPKRPLHRNSTETPPITPQTPELTLKETPRVDTANEVKMRNEFGSFDCFMNAVVQVLWNTTPFRAELKKMIEDENDKRKTNNCINSPGSYNIIDALYGLFLEFEYYDPNNTVPVNAEVLRKLMAKISREFRPGHQADANEFLSGVLEQIHEIMDPKCNCEASSDNCCIAHKVFGQWFDQVHCDRCHSQGEPSFPPFPETSFLPETVSAYELIDRLKSKEPSPSGRRISRQLSYGEAIARCLGLKREKCPDPESSNLSECNTDRLVAVKHRFATSLPKALAISLVWTREDEEQSKVEEFLLCLQQKFKRTELYHSPEQLREKDEAVYRMAGMIVFIYFARDMGHYVAIFRRGKQYKLFDDTRIESLGDSWSDVVRWMVKERRRARPTLLLYELDLGKEKEKELEERDEKLEDRDRKSIKGSSDHKGLLINYDDIESVSTQEIPNSTIHLAESKTIAERISNSKNHDDVSISHNSVVKGRDLPARRSWTSWTSPDRDSEKDSEISTSSISDSGSKIIAQQRELEAHIKSDGSSKEFTSNHGRNGSLLQPGDTPGMNRPEGGDVDGDWIRNGISQKAIQHQHLQKLQQMPPGQTSKNILSERWLDDVAMELYEELQSDIVGTSEGANAHLDSYSHSSTRKQKMMMVAHGKLKKDDNSFSGEKSDDQRKRQSFLSLLDETRTDFSTPATQIHTHSNNNKDNADTIPALQTLNLADDMLDGRNGIDCSEVVYASGLSPPKVASHSHVHLPSPSSVNTSSQSMNTSKQRFMKLVDGIMREEIEREKELGKIHGSQKKEKDTSNSDVNTATKSTDVRHNSYAVDGTLYVNSWGYDPSDDAIYSVVLQPKQLQLRSNKGDHSIGELGLKVHCDGTGQVVVYDFSRYHRSHQSSSEEDEILPAEASGKISLMDHLIAINGSPLYATSTDDVKAHLRKVSQPTFDQQNQCPKVELTFSSLSKHVAWFNCPHCDVQNVAERSILMRLIGSGGGVTDVLCESCLQVSRWDTRD